MLLFCSVQNNTCVVLSLAQSVRVLVSHCPLHVYYLTEFAILLFKFREYFHKSMLQVLCDTTQILQCSTYHGSQAQRVRNLLLLLAVLGLRIYVSLINFLFTYSGNMHSLYIVHVINLT